MDIIFGINFWYNIVYFNLIWCYNEIICIVRWLIDVEWEVNLFEECGVLNVKLKVVLFF